MRIQPKFLGKASLLSAVIAGVLYAGLSYGQAKNPSEAIPDRLLTNQDILEMVRNGLSARAVLLRIQDAPCKFDKSSQALETLRAANVPYKVVLAMMQAPELPPVVNGHIPMTIPDSTPVQVALSESLDTAAQKPGYIVYFRVLYDVRIHGLRVIAKGARARGRLLDSRERSRTGEPARLEWNLMDVEAVDGQRIPLRGGSERAGDEFNPQKSVSAEEGEEFQAFTYGARKINVPAPIEVRPKAPASSGNANPK